MLMLMLWLLWLQHRSLVEHQAFDCYFLLDGMWERLVPPAWR